MRIFFFTSSYPYGPGTIWKENELKAFARKNADVTVIPFDFGNNLSKVEDISGISYLTPIFTSSQIISLKKKILSILFSEHSGYFLNHFFSAKVYLTKAHLISWVTESFLTLQLSRHPVIKKLKSISDASTVWYFFWGRETSLVIPLLRSRNYKIACRFHGYDLYKFRNNGYIPYQEAVYLPYHLLFLRFLLHSWHIPGFQLTVPP